MMTYASFFFASATCPEGVDMFVSKFSADGTGFEASTYIGGSQTDGLNGGDMLLYNYGDCFRGEVIVDPNDRILVCSTTSSADFPVEGSTPLPVARKWHVRGRSRMHAARSAPGVAHPGRVPGCATERSAALYWRSAAITGMMRSASMVTTRIFIKRKG